MFKTPTVPKYAFFQRPKFRQWGKSKDNWTVKKYVARLFWPLSESSISGPSSSPTANIHYALF
jgi:hypothetical protein